MTLINKDNISSNTLLSIANFMLKRNDVMECLLFDKSYEEKKIAVLEALKAFHILCSNFPDDNLINQKEFDENFQFANESLSDVCFIDLSPKRINKTLKIILDRTQKLSIILSSKFPKKVEKHSSENINKEEMKFIMSNAGNNVEEVSFIKERLSKNPSYLVYFSLEAKKIVDMYLNL